MIDVVLAIVLTAASVYIYVGLIGYLLGKLAARPLYRWLRRLDRFPAEQALSPIYMQILGVIAGFVLGVGVNIVTDSPTNPVAFFIGVGLLFVTLVIIVSQGPVFAKLARNGGGDISLFRRRLQRYSALRSASSDEWEDALRLVRRVRRVGERLMLRAETLTIRRSLRGHRRQTTLMALAWTINLIFSALILLAVLVADFRTSAAGWAYLAAVIGTIPIAPFVLVLAWMEDRWWPRTVGRELRDEATRIEGTLLRHAPAVPAPPGLGGSIRRLLRWRRSSPS